MPPHVFVVVTGQSQHIALPQLATPLEGVPIPQQPSERLGVVKLHQKLILLNWALHTLLPTRSTIPIPIPMVWAHMIPDKS
jgi:hypothetical protein